MLVASSDMLSVASALLFLASLAEAVSGVDERSVVSDLVVCDHISSAISSASELFWPGVYCGLQRHGVCSLN